MSPCWQTKSRRLTGRHYLAANGCSKVTSITSNLAKRVTLQLQTSTGCFVWTVTFFPLDILKCSACAPSFGCARLVFMWRKHWRRNLVALVIVVALIAGGIIIDTRHKPKSITTVPVIKGVLTHTTDKPSEAPVAAATYTSTAGPTEPKFINLPTIGASGFIQKMGIDQNNQVAAPNNVNLAGWYVNSLSPGQPGLSIIDGHVNGLHGPGIFLKLSKLQVGDNFTVQLGNGTINRFIVVSVKNIDDQAATATLFARDNRHSEPAQPHHLWWRLQPSHPQLPTANDYRRQTGWISYEHFA